MKEALRSLLKDKRVMNELKATTNSIEPEGIESITPGQELDALLDGRESAISDSSDFTTLEAIILLRGRPVLLIQDDKWEPPRNSEIASWIGKSTDPNNKLVRRIPSVGCIELKDHRVGYVGTGWMLDKDVLVTNRHVVREFGLRKGSKFEFRSGPDGAKYQARVDFRREHQRSDTARARIEQIVLLEEDGDLHPDMALVRVSRTDLALPEPIELDDHPLREGSAEDRPKLAVIGYPAEDGRNDASAMRQIFNGVYRVKRLSPGRLMTVSPNGKTLEHDCTTLGGNSGSPVINLATGKACALHFSGTYRERNRAVTAAWIKSRLASLSSTTISIGSSAKLLSSEEGVVRKTSEFADRRGYDPAFLGAGADLEVPLPEVGQDMQSFIARVNGSSTGLLNYTHFSIQVRSDRRMPFFTAVNIDGCKLYNFPRGRDVWFMDERLDPSAQWGESLYRGNKLDRGHLVRRLDPVWGDTREEAKQAELDTFAFTNCTPQHSLLNQKTWLSLEEYILGNIGTRDFKASVFSGPVMSDSDMEYRGARIPREFWKVAVMVDDQTERLSATGYLLSQTDYLRDIEFVFGEFRTYQVALAEIEKKTGLSFNLSLFDPLGATETAPWRELVDATDITT